MHCRMFSSVPGFYPLDVRSIPDLSYENPKYFQTWSKVPGGQSWPQLRTTELDPSLCGSDVASLFRVLKGFLITRQEGKDRLKMT